MCFALLKHFMCATLLLLLIDKYDLYSVTYANVNSFNSSEEIRNIFDETKLKHINGSMQKGNKSGNFAEGGTIFTNSKTNNNSFINFHDKTQLLLSSKSKNNSHTTENYIPKEENFPVLQKNKSQENTAVSKSSTSFLSFTTASTTTTTTTTTSNKLNDVGINLYFGMPEVVHVSGTSSIKPRKGVYFNKIVPRKGVNIDNDTSSIFEESCFWITKSECYSSVDFANTECNCCEKGNSLGRIIVQQPILNCSNCKTLTSQPLGNKTACYNLCCSDKLLEKQAYSISTSEDVVDKTKSHISGNKTNKSNQENISDGNLLKKVKSKPTITKVPYDVEVVTGLLGKTNKDVVVPVLVSIFLLPLLVALVFLIWKRTKEYWEKRYYKRMDFLIDGMYND